MGILISKSEASRENLLMLRRRNNEPQTMYPVDGVDKTIKGGDTTTKGGDETIKGVDKTTKGVHALKVFQKPVKNADRPKKWNRDAGIVVVLGSPVPGAVSSATGRPRLAGTIDELPWLFPDKDGPAHTSTICMNVWGNNVVCAACNTLASDYRGTVFQCCKAVVCSRCTVRACLGPAERLRLDLHRSLSGSGRVLEGVLCPSCNTRESVGFPVNGNYGRIYCDSGEKNKKTE